MDNDPKIEIWRPRADGDLEPIEVMAVKNGGDTSYRTRPVGRLDWRITMSKQVITTYYEPTGELVEAA